MIGKLKIPPAEMAGIVWWSYRVGVGLFEMRDAEERFRIRLNYGRVTYSAYTEGGTLGRRYKSMRTAAAAVARFINKPWDLS